MMMNQFARPQQFVPYAPPQPQYAPQPQYMPMQQAVQAPQQQKQQPTASAVNINIIEPKAYAGSDPTYGMQQGSIYGQGGQAPVPYAPQFIPMTAPMPQTIVPMNQGMVPFNPNGMPIVPPQQQFMQMPFPQTPPPMMDPNMMYGQNVVPQPQVIDPNMMQQVPPQPMPQVPTQPPMMEQPVPQPMPQVVPQPVMEQPIQQPVMEQPMPQPMPADQGAQPVDQAPVAPDAQAVDQAAPAGQEEQFITVNDIPKINQALTNTDENIKGAALEAIARLGQGNEQTYANLIGEVNRDTSKMTGDSKALAEENKQHAIYTLAILNKNQNPQVPLQELPGADEVLNVLKKDPNPKNREAAISAFDFMAKPEDAPILDKLFNTALNVDKDPGVKAAAQKAITNLQAIQAPAADPAAQAAEVAADPNAQAQAQPAEQAAA